MRIHHISPFDRAQLTSVYTVGFARMSCPSTSRRGSVGWTKTTAMERTCSRMIGVIVTASNTFLGVHSAEEWSKARASQIQTLGVGHQRDSGRTKCLDGAKQALPDQSYMYLLVSATYYVASEILLSGQLISHILNRHYSTYDSCVYGRGTDAIKLKRSGSALTMAAEFSFIRRDKAI